MRDKQTPKDVCGEANLRDADMTFKCANNLAPGYLCSNLLKRTNIQDRLTCNRNSLKIPIFKTASGEQSFAYRAVKIWNDLDSLYGDVVLFFFSFFSKTLASEVSVREQAWSARKKNKECLFSSSPNPTPLHGRSINPLQFIFYHTHSTDFEEKIEGL